MALCEPRNPRYWRILLVICVALTQPACANSLPLEKQRGLFAMIEKRVADNPGLLQRYRGELEGYPLLPYLQTRVYHKRFKEYDAELPAFLQQWSGTPFAEYLRSEWLQYLADRSRKERFLAVWQGPQSPALECARLGFALSVPATRDLALDEFGVWWGAGREVPKACRVVEKSWLQERPPTRDQLWARIEQATRGRHNEVVLATEKMLGEADKPLRYLAELLRASPEQALQPQLFSGFAREEWMLRIRTLERIAWRDAETGLRAFEQVEGDPRLPEDLRGDLMQTLALSLATEAHPAASGLLAAVPASAADDRVRGWRIIDAMRRGALEEADAWLSRLPEEEKDLPRWRYLKGRSLELQGQPDLAEKIWNPLLEDANYYGFVTRARMDRSDLLPDPRLPVESVRVEKIRQHPGMVRAQEWIHLKNSYKARREWYAVVRSLEPEDTKAAVVLADEWGWADLVIYALGRMRVDGAWDYRFPLPHQTTVAREADRHGIDPSWAFAITRQESAFAPLAKSSAGALGLMQLLPGTAQLTARKHQIRYQHANDLLRPTINISLGVAHLGDLILQNQGDYISATAAYNAGQGAVNRWRQRLDHLPVDLWIEAIPFYETRHYVKNVMAYSAIYAHKMKRESRAFAYLVSRMGAENPRYSRTD